MPSNEVILTIKGDDKASAKLDKVQGKAKALGKALGGALRKGAAAGALAVGALGVASVKMALDFEKSLGEVRTLLPQLSDEGFKKLKTDVIDFSNEMGIATTEAVPALYQAISAGVPQENVFDFMEVASKAAIGGVTSLEVAVDGITSVTNSYSDSVHDATTVSDLMFTAVKLGKTDFEQLSASLFNVVPTASSLGIKFEEIAAAMAVMTAQGVPTSVATTQLRQALVEASKSGTDLDAAIQQLSGKTFAEMIAAGGSMSGIFEDLRSSMPDQEFKDLFGSVEAMNAVLQITGPNAEGMADALDEMKDSAGATNTAFETMEQTTSRKLEKAMNLLKNTMLVIGMEILPLVAAALEKLTPWLAKHLPEGIQDLKDAFATMKPFILDFIAGFEIIVGVIKTVWDTFGLITAGKGQIVAAFVLIGAAALLAFGPIGPIVLGVAVAITALGSALGANRQPAQMFASAVDIAKTSIAEMGGEVDRFSLLALRNDIKDFANQDVPTWVRGSDEFGSSIAGMIQGAIDMGATLEEATQLAKDSAVENIPQVIAVLADLDAALEANKLITIVLQEEQRFTMRSMGIEADASREIVVAALDSEGVAMSLLRTEVLGLHPEIEREFQAIAGTAEDMEARWKVALGSATTEAEGMAGDSILAFISVAPTLDEEVEKWLESMRKAGEANVNYRENIIKILSNVATEVLPEQFGAIENAVLKLSPAQAQVYADMADGNKIAFLESIGLLPGLAADEVGNVTTELQTATAREKGVLYGIFFDWGDSAMRGFTFAFEGAQVESAVHGMITRARNAGYKWLEASSPSKVFERMGKTVGEGFGDGIDLSALQAKEAAQDLAKGIVLTIQEVLQLNAAGLIDDFVGQMKATLEFDAGLVKAPAASVGDAIADAIEAVLQADAQGLIDDFATALNDAMNGVSVDMAAPFTSDLEAMAAGFDGATAAGVGFHDMTEVFTSDLDAIAAGFDGATAAGLGFFDAVGGGGDPLDAYRNRENPGNVEGMDRNTPLGQFLAAMGAGLPNESWSGFPIGDVRHQWFRELVGPEITDMIRAFRRGNPDFAHGGVVPGAIGAPMLATVHGGERILTPAQQGGNITININAIDGASVKAIVPEIIRELNVHQRGSGGLTI